MDTNNSFRNGNIP